MTAGIAILYGTLGMIIGSFLNVLIYRIPQHQSIVFPGSHCPACKQRLKPWELLPVLSYMFLGGKCTTCKQRISWRYPAVELLTGVLFVLTVLLQKNQSLTALVFDLVFVSLLITLTFIDIDTFRLPDVLVGLVGLIGFIQPFVTGDPTIAHSLGGAIGAGSIFLLIAYFYPEGMGLGDVKFVAALGLYLGSPHIFFVIFMASLLGVIIGGTRVVLGKKDLKDPIPFGPFLAAGAFLVMLKGAYLLEMFGL